MKHAIGEQASFSVTITQELVDGFVALTGDDNPVHTDAAYARSVNLGRPVVHGMLSASFVSTLIGKYLPGPGALWVSQDFEFVKPVRVGDVLSLTATVRKVHDKLELLTLDIVVDNQDGVSVLTGTGIVRVGKSGSSAKAVSRDSDPGAVLITGASGAIGSEVARVLAANGHAVILQYHRGAAYCDKLAEEITAAGGRAYAAQADLRIAIEVKNLAAASAGYREPLWGLVHCASLPIAAEPFDTLNWSDVSAHIDVAAQSLFDLCQSIIPNLVDNGGGSIVAISTQALDEIPTKGWLAYLAGKSIGSVIVKSLAAEFGPRGIRANLVSPGMVDTEMVADIPQRFKLTVQQNTPVRRLCEPGDIAEAVRFLIGSDSSFINGETLRINGGILMR